MKLIKFIALLSLAQGASLTTSASDFKTFPDGSPVPQWFNDTSLPDLSGLGKSYVVTDFGVKQDSTIIQTDALQNVIDQAANDGGGVIVIPEGTFLSGSLFFK
ncbi:MAG: exopolygalacturonase, partial [Muribaculaceae bacterium]|nr:exopolygalacturonase [Muribaculaceae bacterium]